MYCAWNVIVLEMYPCTHVLVREMFSDVLCSCAGAGPSQIPGSDSNTPIALVSTTQMRNWNLECLSIYRTNCQILAL